jgi:hypothetical protein
MRAGDFLTSEFEIKSTGEMSGQLHASATLRPGKEPNVLIGSEAGGAPDRVWTKWRLFLPYRDSNSDLSVVQPVVSRYTDCAIPAPETISNDLEIM